MHRRRRRKSNIIYQRQKLTVIAVGFFILIVVFGVVRLTSKADADTAIPTTVTQDMALSSASGVVPPSNIDNNPLNYIPAPSPLQVVIDGTTYSYGYLAYGQPNGDYINGDYRYSGYDVLNEAETNLAFPPDENANGADFASQNWVYTPWSVKATGATMTQWDGDTSYTDDLITGILWTTDPQYNVNGYTITYADAGNPLWDNITDYAQILMPPTKYTWGIARMWHYKNGNLFYVTVPMPPLILAQLIPPVVEPAKLIVKPRMLRSW